MAEVAEAWALVASQCWSPDYRALIGPHPHPLGTDRTHRYEGLQRHPSARSTAPRERREGRAGSHRAAAASSLPGTR